MKKLTILLLAVLMALSLCACGQSGSISAESAETTWQEQYDMGIKYLDEGNYKEAIVAFTAAIEIDPKQPTAYLSLADAYIGQGDMNAAKKALKDGLTACGEEESLRAKMDEISLVFSGFSSRENYVDISRFSVEQRKFLEALLSCVLQGDWDSAWSALGEDSMVELRFPGGDMGSVYTEYNDYRVELDFQQSNGDYQFIGSIELRPINGTAYYCGHAKALDGAEFWDYGSGACENWNWNGEFTSYQKWYSPGDRTQTNKFAGTTVDNLLNGEETREYTNQWDPSEASVMGGEITSDSSVTTYENGICISEPEWNQGGLSGIFTIFEESDYLQYDWRD